MFTVCSFLCGIATSLAQLIIFRLAQGFFGGGLQPNQQSIILDTFPPAKRGAAFGGHRDRDHRRAGARSDARRLHHRPGELALDFLHQRSGRRARAYSWCRSLVEDPPWVKSKRRRGIDYIGLSLITLGLGALQIMMDRGEDDGLVRIRLHLADGAAGVSRHPRRDRLAADRQEADRQSGRLQGPQFRGRLHPDRRDGRDPVRQRGHHPAIRPAEP